MTMIRDFFRRRTLARYITENGWKFNYHSTPVSVSKDSDLAVLNALIKGKYEAEEARLITTYMPPDRPVIELGRSLGVVSGFIRSRMEAGEDHVIVEANPNLIDICKTNAGGSRVVCRALSYSGDWANLEINDKPHASVVRKSSNKGARTVQVETKTLADLWAGIGRPRAIRRYTISRARRLR